MRKLLIALSVFVLSFPFASNAEEALLTIGGKTDRTANSSIQLTLGELEAIDMSTVETRTPWHKEKTRFSGVSGAALLKYLGATATEVDAIALNDYKVTLPVSDLSDTGLIFATRKNGEPMSIREKGPIFVIYPFDADPSLDNEVIYGRSIWQLKALEFK